MPTEEPLLRYICAKKMKTQSKKGLCSWTHTSIFFVTLQTSNIGAKRNSEFHLLRQYLVNTHVSLSFKGEMQCV